MTSLYENVLSLVRELETGDPSGQASDVRATLEGPLRIAIVGRVNAGKSTLLNALLGERLAATDATECTRLVTRYRHGPRYEVAAHTHSGPVVELPFRRDDDGLHMDLSRVALADVEAIEVTSPNAVLRGWTLIDTPGIGSADPGRVAATGSVLGAGEAPPAYDAMIYLLRHAHRTDLEALAALRDRWASQGSAFNVVAVLSRADEIGGGRPDAMESASKIALRYEEDGRLRGLATRVVPASGLLAETGATLREEEYRWLRVVAGEPDEPRSRALLAASLFLGQVETALTVEVRRLLLRRLGLFGLRLAVAAIREGSAADAPRLARLLAGWSGLESLRAAVGRQFGDRARTLKAVAAVRALRALAPVDGTPGLWRARLEELESISPELVQLQTFQAAVDGELSLSADQVGGLLALLSPGRPAQRLLLPDDSTAEVVRACALRAIEEWRSRAMDPLADRTTSSACEVAVHAAEQIYAATVSGGPLSGG